jgi:hypothetical protein
VLCKHVRVFKQPDECCSVTRIVASYHEVSRSNVGTNIGRPEDGTERRGRMVNTSASYSGGPRFKYRPEDRLS